MDSLRELFVEDTLKEVLEKTEEVIRFNYADDEDETENIWTNNCIETESLPSLFKMVQEECLSTQLTLHLTIDGSESSYEMMETRIILFDGLKPIYTEYFDEIMDTNDGMYQGVQKAGFSKLIKAALMYHEYNHVSV